MTSEHPNDLLAHEVADRRVLLRALGVAIAQHASLLAVALPRWDESTPQAAANHVYVIHQVRFQAFPRRAASAPSQQQHRKALRFPVPDPTPDDPEPILRELETLPGLELPDLGDAVFSIPDAPGPMRVDGRIPFEVGGEVSAPVKVYGPAPPYTEEARLARIQGVVMLRTTIDIGAGSPQ
jgi:outer membrane biosynthesis protein TonB